MPTNLININTTTSTNPFIYWPYRVYPWPEQEQPVSITSIEQLDALETGAGIVITRPGLEPEEWVKQADDKWSSVKARRGRIASRHFRGAIEGGILTRAVGGRRGATADSDDPYRWKIGDRWFVPGGGERDLYVITAEEVSNPNCLHLVYNDGIRAQRTTLQNLRDSGYRRIGHSGTRTPTQGNWSALLNEGAEAMLSISQTKVPEELTEELRAYILANPSGELLGLLTKHGIDLSVDTDAKAEGTSEVKGDDLAMLLGVNSKMQGSIETPWSAEFKARVVPGCICDTNWEEAVVDRDLFNLSIPEDYKDITVALTCPVHPDGKQ